MGGLGTARHGSSGQRLFNPAPGLGFRTLKLKLFKGIEVSTLPHVEKRPAQMSLKQP